MDKERQSLHLKNEAPWIVLTGLPGAGKSSVGLWLEKLGFASYLDLDSVIVSAAGMPIAQIIRVEGEQRFRDLEARLLSETLARAPEKSAKAGEAKIVAGADVVSTGGLRAVLSLGGGALLREDNRKLVKSHGIVVYLEVSPSVAAKRAIEDELAAGKRAGDRQLAGPLRPVLFTAELMGCLAELGSDEEMSARDAAEEKVVKRVSELLAVRGEIYRELADLTFSADTQSAEEIAREIVRVVSGGV